MHYPSWVPDEVVARRLLAVNLSDLAAVGASPEHALLSLSGPPEWDRRNFLDSLVSACESHGVSLVGGDLARHEEVVATLVLLGRRPEAGRWVRRDAARPGDVLWSGGDFGESAAGRRLLERHRESIDYDGDLVVDLSEPAVVRAIRRHLLPRPQLRLGEWLGSTRRAAAIDVSDGLALDLHRLARSSDVGAVVEHVPIDDEIAALLSDLGHDPEKEALSGGEDYVLLFTLPPGVSPPSDLGCRRLGSIVERGVWRRRDGALSSLEPEGWDHL